ncbi:ABC transporter substrate-binding protein [Bacillaceae bacterium IKA-2]|nr:ABC transporter substrate-binding protein [Bacillaceae bacterium IKA-2]
MKKNIFISIIAFLTIIIIAGCGQKDTAVSKESEAILEENWEDIAVLAEETEVRIFMWGGDDGINQYMDEWVAPNLMEQYGVKLVRTPMDTHEILQKLMTEKRANKNEGTIDIFWLNGENFKNAKENDLLWGSFAPNLPNYLAYIDGESLDVNYDFGTPVDGLEAPWGKAQFVFQYDSAKVANPPTTFADLKIWMEENPGRFTYPEANDFTGNAFIRHLFYESVGDIEMLLENGYDAELANASSDQMWSYLNEIKPYLWRKGETYPQTLTDLDRLYSQGEVWMTMGYNEARAVSFIEDGIFPETTETFVLESGSIGNTHFLTVPFNSPNKSGALVAINYLLSPEAQLAKMEPGMWGENMALDPTKLGEEHQQHLATLDRGKSVLAAEILQEHLLPEVDSRYVEWIKENWLYEVVQFNQ